METKIVFRPNRSQYNVQVRASSQWFWRTCRMPSPGMFELFEQPIFFATRDEANEFIEKMQLKTA